MNYRKLIGVVLLGLLIILVTLLGACGPKTEEPIKIVGFSVEYGAIQAQVFMRSLEAKGYTWEYTETNSMGPLYLGIAQGDYDVFTDSWMPEFHKEYYDTHPGKLEIIGNLYGENVPTGLVVPQFVIDEYGIKSFDDLKGNSDVFGGKIFGYEPGTGGMMKTEKVVETYGLEDEYEIVYGSVPILMAEVKAKYDLGKPIVYCGWRPHPTMAMMDLVFLEDPQAIFGTNYVGVCVNSTLKDRAPDVYHYLQNQVVPLLDVEAMMAESETVDDAMALADQWWEANQELVESWWK